MKSKILRILMITAILLSGTAVVSADSGYTFQMRKLPDAVSELRSEKDGNGRTIFIDKDGKWGFLDQNDHIIASGYETVYPYNQFGVARVEMADWNIGLIDLDGNEILPPVYERISGFNGNGYAVIENSHFKRAIINAKGEIMTDWYDFIYDYEDDSILARKTDESTVLLNEKLEEIDLSQYDYVDTVISDGMIAAEKNGKYGFIDIAGNEVIPLIYDYIQNNKFHNGVSVIKKDGKYGYIDTEGKKITPIIYDSAQPFLDKVYISELAAASIDGRIDLINTKGKTVYSDVQSMTNPYIMVDGERWEIDLLTGEKYQDPGYEIMSSFYNGRALARKGGNYGRYGIVDEAGNIVHDFDIPQIVTYISYGRDGANVPTPPEISEGFISVCLDDKWGYMDTNGNMVIEPQFDKYYGGITPTITATMIPAGAGKFSHGYAKVSVDSVKYTIDRHGNRFVNLDIINAPQGDFPYLFLWDDYAALRDEKENTILEIKDGTLRDLYGNTLLKNCVNSVLRWEDTGEHPVIKFVSKNMVTVQTADGVYAIKIIPQPEIAVLVNHEALEMDTMPFITNGRVYIPMRAVFEKLGAEITWDDEHQTVTAITEKHNISISAGRDVMILDEEEITLNAPVILTDGRIFVPIRAVTEALGAQVLWDENARCVEVTNLENK